MLLALGLTGLWVKTQVARVLAAEQTDPEWIRMWEAAQKHRPALVPSVARIAPAGESGQPMIVHGRLFAKTGTDPVGGAVIFAYQTGQDGLYQRPGQPGWRLQGWARTAADGSFEFQTIRPAPYPDRSIPAHIHLSVEGPRIPRGWLPEVQFADDPLITDDDRRASEREGMFGHIRPVRTVDGVQLCDLNLRLTGAQRF